MSAILLRSLRVRCRFADIQAALDPLGHLWNRNEPKAGNLAAATSPCVQHHRYSASVEGDSLLHPAGLQSEESLGRDAEFFQEHAGAASTDAGETAEYSPTVFRTANLPEDFVPEVPESPVSETAEPSRKERRDATAVEGEIPMPRFTNKTQEAGALRGQTLSLVDAIAYIKENAKAKFDETVEAHFRLGIDPKRGDQTVDALVGLGGMCQIVRGAASLPRGLGKSVRVAVFAEGAAAQEAIDAGADLVGGDDLVAQVKESGGKLDFDKCIATPALMPRLGQVARILGPRGLMPNPKVGSVTMAVGEAVRAAKHGKVDFRADKSGIVHAGIGKVSFAEEALVENLAAFATALMAAKPAGLKRSSRYAGYFHSISLASTMGRGVRVNVQSVAAAADSLMKRA